jgi:putative colanic acid biosynthesis UDP-glucose lipid carrier transferase
MSDDRMRARVEHDLFYIDNWSMWLDIEILWLTLTSKRGYTNAF